MRLSQHEFRSAVLREVFDYLDVRRFYYFDLRARDTGVCSSSSTCTSRAVKTATPMRRRTRVRRLTAFGACVAAAGSGRARSKWCPRRGRSGDVLSAREREIARELAISHKTVEKHLASAYAKLGSALARAQLAAHVGTISARREAARQVAFLTAS